MDGMATRRSASAPFPGRLSAKRPPGVGAAFLLMAALSMAASLARAESSVDAGGGPLHAAASLQFRITVLPSLLLEQNAQGLSVRHTRRADMLALSSGGTTSWHRTASRGALMGGLAIDPGSPLAAGAAPITVANP